MIIVPSNVSGAGAAPLVATGGWVTEVDGWRVHTFLTDGTFTVSELGDDNTLEYLVVGGGGGGGGAFGAGGGAGGFREGTITAAVQSYPVVVGKGGAGGLIELATPSTNGYSSSFAGIVAAGGGPGGRYNGGNGGSGGGSGREQNSPGLGNTPSVSPSQGNDGGMGGAEYYGTGGGGGAGGAGGSTTYNEKAGPGGVGKASSITGTAAYYGGGGGGSGYYVLGSDGGLGGGGNGGIGAGSAANMRKSTHGTYGTGGGGGGGSTFGVETTGANGGFGGSGIVIIRYRAEPVNPPAGTPVQFRAAINHFAPAYNPGSSFVCPTHQPGDVLLMFTSNYGTGLSVAPTPGGVVPAWQPIASAETQLRLWYAIATRSDHQTGVWAGMGEVWQLVMASFYGANNSNPIGAYGLFYPGGSAYAETRPLTLQDVRGNSQVITFYHAYESANTAWHRGASGFTERTYLHQTAQNGTKHVLASYTQNATHGAPSVPVGTFSPGAGYVKTATVEIKSV